MSNDSLFWSRVIGPTLARYGWFLIVIPLALANLSAFRVMSQPKTYTSTIRFAIGNTPTELALGINDATGTLLISRELRVAQSYATTRNVDLNNGKTSLASTVAPTTNEIVLTATARTPTTAQSAADAYGDAYLAESAARRSIAYKRAAGFVEQSIQKAETEQKTARTEDQDFYRLRLVDLKGRLANIRELASKAATTTVQPTDPASLPTAPNGRSVTSAALLGLIFGIGVCGAVILLLDFGEKQRVSLDDVRNAPGDLRILGVTPYKRLRKAALIGHAVRGAIEKADAQVVAVAFLGSRLKTSKVSESFVASLVAAGERAVLVHPSFALDTPHAVGVAQTQNEWSVSMRDPSFALDARDAVRKALVDSRLDFAIVEGPQIRDSTASAVGIEMSDAVVLVVDALSTTSENLTEALINLENLDRQPIGVIFFQR